MITIAHRPPLFSFAGNENSYTLSCNSTAIAPHLIYATVSFTLLGAVGDSLCISFGGRTLRWRFVSSASVEQYNLSSLYELQDKLIANYYILDTFDVSLLSKAETGTVSIILTQRRAVTMELSVWYERHDGNAYSSPSDYFTMTSSSAKGLSRQSLENYAVMAQLEVLTCEGNLVTTSLTEPMFFSPDASDRVKISLDILAGLFPAPDLPKYRESGITPLLNVLLKYRLRISEMYGTTPILHDLVTDAWRYSLPGEEVATYADLNLPDWKDPSPAVSLSETTAASAFRLIGEDNGAKKSIYYDQPECLYILCFDAMKTLDDTLTLTVTISGSVTATITKSVTNGGTYRLALEPRVIGAPAYGTLVVTVGGSTVTYFVLPSMQRGHMLLLQDRYGLLRSVPILEEKEQQTVEGELMQSSRLRDYAITSRTVTYTATTPLLSISYAHRLRDGNGRWAYALTSSGWERILITPGTLSVWDESEDFASLTFDYTYALHQAEARATRTDRPAGGSGDVLAPTTAMTEGNIDSILTDDEYINPDKPIIISNNGN
jgi:hypothetical protein